MDVICEADASGVIPSPLPEEYTLEQRLFHRLRSQRIRNPSAKEFNEAFSFCNAVRRSLGPDLEVVLDVAGGHGALGALFLLLTRCSRAIVIDPAVVEQGKQGIVTAWGDLLASKSLQYLHECLRTGLPSVLHQLRNEGLCGSGGAPRVLVVACHACQHLTEEILAISSEFGAHVCVMPCCHKDHDGTWKAMSHTMGLELGLVMDLLSAGRMMNSNAGLAAGVRYAVRMKTISRSITPQNRLIICRAIPLSPEDEPDTSQAQAHMKLMKAYQRAHLHQTPSPSSYLTKASPNFIQSTLLGASCFLAGAVVALLLVRLKHQ